MVSDDDDILEHWEKVLSPAEFKALKWILQDPTRPYCSKDLMDALQITSKGSARNINLGLKKRGLIELYSRSLYAFYKLRTTDQSKMRKPVTISRMGVNGVKRLKVDLVAMLEHIPVEELGRVHDVHLKFTVDGLYDPLLIPKKYAVNPYSKDISFGSFVWSKYRSGSVFLHHNGTVSVILDCSDCPVEVDTMGFVSMAGFLGGVRYELLNACKMIGTELSDSSIPLVDFWIVTMWHYGKDSAQEFSGEAFNITFKMWCGELARIYVHEQEESRKVRFEVTQTPKKPIHEILANKLCLCCGGCFACTKHS
jgi:hypothetical protein